MTEEALSNMVVLQAKAGMERNVAGALTRLTGAFREAEGCLQYDCFQSFENPGRFMLVMQWRDEASLALHLASEGLRELFESLAGAWLEDFSREDYRAFSRGIRDLVGED
ncbi:MAG: antibiotic biosynthesis monooxygenase [bacterium]